MKGTDKIKKDNSARVLILINVFFPERPVAVSEGPDMTPGAEVYSLIVNVRIQSRQASPVIGLQFITLWPADRQGNSDKM